MPPRPIVRYPDPRLATPAAPVERFDDDLRRLAADLLDTLRAAPAVGITAPHVGVPQRLAVVVLDAARGPQTLVNPRIEQAGGGTIRHEEGSVSMPGVIETIERDARVVVVFQDLDGSERREEFEGFAAVVLQHEIDQLDGVFFLDRLSRLKRERVLKRWRKTGGAAGG